MYYLIQMYNTFSLTVIYANYKMHITVCENLSTICLYDYGSLKTNG